MQWIGDWDDTKAGLHDFGLKKILHPVGILNMACPGRRGNHANSFLLTHTLGERWAVRYLEVEVRVLYRHLLRGTNVKLENLSKEKVSHYGFEPSTSEKQVCGCTTMSGTTWIPQLLSAPDSVLSKPYIKLLSPALGTRWGLWLRHCPSSWARFPMLSLEISLT
jgi:hypothetical protein